MTRKYFGTDGIRGTANSSQLNPEIAMKVGQAAGIIFRRGDHINRVVIGKDTRLSGYMFESALMSGFTSVGMEVLLLGPMPTPAVAMITRSMRADLGVMISASHNTFEDNGIKLFGPDGFKLSDKVEHQIEDLMESRLAEKLVPSSQIGRVRRVEASLARYVEFAKRTLPRNMSFDGLRIVVDCANGAAYRVAPEALWELGAEVIKIGDKPDGRNINENCGSTSLKAVRDKVIEVRADIGIALDGDADRVIIIDEKGEVVDGDQIMGLIASIWQQKNRLTKDGIVSTVMSNLGLEHFLNNKNLHLLRTNVGDRYVVSAMREQGYNIGGEQSGHLVLGDYCTTGDGLIAALQVVGAVVDSQKPVSEVCHLFEPLPQLLKNIRYASGAPLENKTVLAAIKEGEQALGNKGRILVRKSGTEPLIRVMAEGEDGNLVNRVVEDIAVSIQNIA